MSRGPGQRGHAPAVEAAVILPVLVMVVGLLIVVARLVVADQAVTAAAAQAARAASIERSVARADAAAASAVADGLAARNVRCRSQSMAVDASGLRAPLGTPSSVRVEVSCTVELSDVAFPGFPGTRTVTATGTSPVDTYRQR